MNTRIITLLMFAYSIGLHAQQDGFRPTLSEIVRRQAPAPVLQTRTRELFPESLEEMLPKSDLVVHGTVERMNSYLSTDQTEIHTDYLIRPLRVIRQRSTIATNRPGQPIPIVVTRWGGQMIVDGVEVTLRDLDLPAFYLGEQLLLVLVYNKRNGKYELPSPVSGAFSVDGMRIQPLVLGSAAYDRLRGMTVAEIESEVRRLTP